MGKKSPPKVAKLSPSGSGVDDSAKAGAEPVKVNVYDGGALKGALDECAKHTVLNAGYEEDVSISNHKIILGSIAIAIALYAQFGPGKFPATWWTVLGCVVAYVIVEVMLNVYTWKYEGDAFLVTRPRPGYPDGIRLSSKLDRFDHHYSLHVVDGRPGHVGRHASSTWSVTQFFHEDGYLADAAFSDEVVKVLAEFEGQQQGGSKKDN